MPHFDWTISLGQLVNAAILLLGLGFMAQRMYYTIDKRVSTIEIKVTDLVGDLATHALAVQRDIATHIDGIQQQITIHAEAVERQIETHANTLEDHAGRMERWETTLFKVVSDLQRVIGQMEIRFERRDGLDRRIE